MQNSEYCSCLKNYLRERTYYPPPPPFPPKKKKNQMKLNDRSLCGSPYAEDIEMLFYDKYI